MALTKVSNSMLVQPVNHNILINPSFTVKQRGDVVVHDEASYGPDRWRVTGKNYVGCIKVESSTEVDAATGVNKLVVKHEGTTAKDAHVYQYVETVNLQGLYNKEITLSFGYSDVGGSGIPKVEIRSWDSSDIVKSLYDAVPTSLGDNRWTCTFTLSTADGTIPDPSEHGVIVIIHPNEKNPAPSEWRVWETKLEAGLVVTPFIARQYGEELALCQRYFYIIEEKSEYPFNLLYPERHSLVVNFPVQMRVPPTNTLEPTINNGRYGAGGFLNGATVIDFKGYHPNTQRAWFDVGSIGGARSSGSGGVEISNEPTFDAEL